MTFNAQRKSIAVGRSPAAVKSWVVGWTVDEAQAAAKQSRPAASGRPVPGAYGLLVSSNRR